MAGPSGEIAPGQVVTYTIAVGNDGNVPLTNLGGAAEPNAAPLSCGATVLQPGTSVSCTLDRTVTVADIVANTLSTQLTVYAMDPDGVVSAFRVPITTPLGLTNPGSALGAFDLWTLNPDGNDTAVTGAWSFGVPQQTFLDGAIIQPEGGADGPNQPALVTDGRAGSSAGTYDVDFGFTTIESPAFAVPADEVATLEFSWFFAHVATETADDHLQVQVVEADGSVDVVFEVKGKPEVVPGVWTPAQVDLSSYGGQTIRLRAVALDGANNSLTEAGIDELQVRFGAAGR